MTAKLRTTSHVSRTSGLLLLSGWLLTVLLIARSPAQSATVPAWKYRPELLEPFWRSDVMRGESVLFIRDPETGTARASLLFVPQEILSVSNSAGDQEYTAGEDYVWQPGSREVVLPKGSRITSSLPSDLRRPAKSQKYELTHRDGNGEIFFGAQLEYHALQTLVTYRHAKGWDHPVPKFDEAQLPRTIGKLRRQEPLTIVLLGDSISSGCNASGWAEGAPFQPPFQDLLQQHLAETYHTRVELKNLSIGGRDSAWGLTVVDQIVAAKPDLVLLAFGMNDSAGRVAKDFQANIAQTMQKTRAKLPECEFILIATMLGNRDWTRLHHEYFAEYRDALQELCGPGVALADMTSMWTAFLEQKKDWDLTGNGVNHPNDFGHRVYAQVLSALLIKPQP